MSNPHVIIQPETWQIGKDCPVCSGRGTELISQSSLNSYIPRVWPIPCYPCAGSGVVVGLWNVSSWS